MTFSPVSTASDFALDELFELDSVALESLLAQRPFRAMAQLTTVTDTGDSVLPQLQDYALLQMALQDDSLGTDQSDGSFVLTPNLAEYYLEVMLSILEDDREYFEEIAALAAAGEDVERLMSWIEGELQREIRARVGRVFPSEQELLDELFAMLESLQDRARELLLN